MLGWFQTSAVSFQRADLETVQKTKAGVEAAGKTRDIAWTPTTSSDDRSCSFFARRRCSPSP